MRFHVYVLLALLWPSYACGQDRTNISVTYAGEDIIGKKVVYALREEIRKSSGYAYVEDTSRGYSLALLTMDAGCLPNANVVSVISTVLLFRAPIPSDKPNATIYPIFGLHNVYITGTNRTDDIAKSILADVDEFITELLRERNTNAKQIH